MERDTGGGFRRFIIGALFGVIVVCAYRTVELRNRINQLETRLSAIEARQENSNDEGK